MKNMQARGLRVGGLMLAAASSVAIAGTPVDSHQDLRLPPAMRAHLAKRMAGKVLPSAAAAKPTETYIKLDVDAPTLSSFNVAPSVDAGKAHAQLVFDYAVVDDYAGATSISVTLVGPNDQWASTSISLGYPARKLQGQGALDFDNLAKAGEWMVYTVQVSDNAGNSRYYYGSELEAQGSQVRFTVLNKLADEAPPMLKSGQIQTPSISLSSRARGTQYGPPLAGVTVRVSDEATAGLSGAHTASATFCPSNGGWGCFTVYGINSLRGRRDVQMRMDGELYSYYNEPGDYVLDAMSLIDFAGNTRTLISVNSGGYTDFSAYFPSTHITVLP